VANVSYPPLAELIPHAGNMVFLERVTAHTADATRCVVRVDAQRLFRQPDGSIQSWVAIEYMAQCIAAHGGPLARAKGHRPQLGFLVRARDVSFGVARFVPGQVLSVSVRHLWGSASGMVTFEGRVEAVDSSAGLVSGRLSCYTPAEGVLHRSAAR